MSRNPLSLSLFLPLALTASLLAGAAVADVPRVATDIAPVHSLVARVMEGAGSPDLVVSPGASPHEYSLRPSQAAALQAADLVFRVSPDLMPWLDDSIETLARDASVTTLLEVDGTTVLPIRESPLFEAHGHEEEPGHDDLHDGDDHAADADTHGAHDPHAWLSPDNAAVWMDAIAAALSAADPENAGVYSANAAAGQDELAALSSDIDRILDPVRGREFIVFHDAYRYFEHAFDFPASGAIAISDATDPGPAAIAAIQTRVAEQGVTCVLSEPQFDPGLVATVMDGSSARMGVLDPLGAGLEPGPDLYSRMLRDLATALAECL